MTTDNGRDKNDPEPRNPEPRPTTIEELRRRAICKKRYGRVTLTIRRWGGYGDLIGDSDLAKKVTAFRARDATAEEVALAFVRARVKSHSPTFRWKDAELDRLILLVADCSQSPHFKARTADELAEELVKAQDEERERLKRLSAQFAQSFAGISNFSELMRPQIGEWAAQQQRLFAGLSRSLVMPSLGTSLTGLATASVQQQMRTLGLTATVRRQMFPTLQPALTRSLIGQPLATSLLAQRVRLLDAIYGEFLEVADSLTRTSARANADAGAGRPLTSALSHDLASDKRRERSG